MRRNEKEAAAVTTPPRKDDVQAAAPERAGYRYYVLAILILVYAFNFLDRQIIGILAVPIKRELELTDSQLGLMGGVAFAFLYSTLGVPIAWLADRINRTWIMTVALTVWSGATALCGVTQNFAQLFFARMGVGVGEAGGVAPAYTIVADYFPPHQRARALALYSFGIPIGSAAGIVFGGVIAHIIDWSAAFIIVGLTGVALAPLFKLTVREPVRGAFDPGYERPAAIPGAWRKRLIAVLVGAALFGAAATAILIALDALGVAISAGAAWFVRGGAIIVGAAMGLAWEVVRVLLRKPSFWLLTLGASASSMMGYGIFFWLPSFFVRSFKLTVLDASLLYGGIVLVGGMAGIAAGGVLADRLGAKKRSAYAIVPAIAFALILPFYVGGVLAPNVMISLALFLVPTGLSLLWLGPALSAFQHLVPPAMRATASSVFLLVNNLIGIGGGIYLLGAISDALRERFAEESLRYAILTGAGFYLLAAMFFLLAALFLARDWEGEPAAAR